jgi:D-alanyl-D-alanine carboxypeptidase (penicillin-binding protein 5/6)
MFLAEGQKVSLHELLEGLSVSSGNDATYAVASYVSGSIEAFVERMNSEMENLGLTLTHFVVPSGDS